MSYYDDILNIDAYLRNEMRKNAQNSRILVQRINERAAELQGMIKQTDDLMVEFQRIADKLGVDLSDIPMPEVKPVQHESADLRIDLPDDFNFAKSFDELTGKHLPPASPIPARKICSLPRHWPTWMHSMQKSTPALKKPPSCNARMF